MSTSGNGHIDKSLTRKPRRRGSIASALAPIEAPDARQLLYIGRIDGKAAFLAVRIDSMALRPEPADLQSSSYITFESDALRIYYATEDKE